MRNREELIGRRYREEVIGGRIRKGNDRKKKRKRKVELNKKLEGWQRKR